MTEKKERFEVLLENIQGDVRAVLDGHITIRSEMGQMEERLSKKIDFVDGKVEHIGREIREIKGDVMELKTKLDKIDRTLDDHVRLPAHAGV